MEQPLPHHGQLGQTGDGDIGKALLDVGVVVHSGPLNGLQAVAHKEVNAQTEGGQGQTGDVLVGLKGHRQRGEQQSAQRPHKKGGKDAYGQTVGVAAHNVAEDRAHGHNALYAQIQAAGLFHHDLPYRSVEQRDIVHHNVVNEGGHHPQLIHFHGCFPLSELGRS